MSPPKHLHFIGICGVAMSALAVAFKKAGATVTGSDVGFFPPVSTRLKAADIDFYPGWHPKKMIARGVPDVVVVGAIAGSNNREWRYVTDHQIPYTSYPELVSRYLIKPHSIVVAGTFGKTTSSALLAWILHAAGLNPSYLFGGLLNTDWPAAALEDSPWSLIEGDEYKSARWDARPKFAHYRPTHLMLTSAVWDHTDIYPTAAAYHRVFAELIKSIPPAGAKIISEKVDPHLLSGPARRYGAAAGNDYAYGNVETSGRGVAFDVFYQNQTTRLSLPCLGAYMADNATGCFALAHTIGISPETIARALATFPGLKRRLEKRSAAPVTVFDDIAHSPAKAQAVLSSLRALYAGKIFAVFEPNAGNRRPVAAPWYAHAFKEADEVIIPQLTKIKTDPADPVRPFDGERLAEVIGQTHPAARYLGDDGGLIEYLYKKTARGDVVVFMGSHGFRGMIEELINRVSDKQSKPRFAY